MSHQGFKDMDACHRPSRHAIGHTPNSPFDPLPPRTLALEFITLQSGKCSTVPSLISICVSVLQFGTTVEQFHLNFHFNLQF